MNMLTWSVIYDKKIDVTTIKATLKNTNKILRTGLTSPGIVQQMVRKLSTLETKVISDGAKRELFLQFSVSKFVSQHAFSWN